MDNSQGAEGSFSDLVQLVQKNPRLFPIFAVTAWTVWHHRSPDLKQLPCLWTD